MKIVCIVQARRRSTRLPNKILLPLGGHEALFHVLNRCQSIPGIDQVICAGVDDPYEDPIFEIAHNMGVTCFRGSENDVLSRYYLAAQEAGADWVMRVTSDCPLFDPDVAGTLVRNTLESGAHFGANAGWPHGLDCELFTFDLLEKAYLNAATAGEREHVTLWMKRLPGLKMYHQHPPETPALDARYRWVLDYPEDYAFMKAVYTRLGDRAGDARWQDIVKMLAQEPELMQINAGCADKWAQEDAKIHNTP